jgi:endonuclease YncB( thermonuclease family)
MRRSERSVVPLATSPAWFEMNEATNRGGLIAGRTGVPRVVYGDTLAIGATKVRLEGIDAPETDQVCSTRLVKT